MNFQSYDDYMRSLVGFPNMNCQNMCSMNNPAPFGQSMFQAADNLERMYPDTYRIVFPMVVSACNMVTMPITEEMLDRMTDDIYDRAATDSRISIDINIGIETRDENSAKQNSDEVRQRRPMRRNRFFRDFIRVLLLRELLERRNSFPFRPF